MFDYNIAYQWICLDTRKTLKNNNAKAKYIHFSIRNYTPKKYVYFFHGQFVRLCFDEYIKSHFFQECVCVGGVSLPILFKFIFIK